MENLLGVLSLLCSLLDSFLAVESLFFCLRFFLLSVAELGLGPPSLCVGAGVSGFLFKSSTFMLSRQLCCSLNLWQAILAPSPLSYSTRIQSSFPRLVWYDLQGFTSRGTAFPGCKIRTRVTSPNLLKVDHTVVVQSTH